MLLPYWNALGNAFLGDDEALLERNPLLRSGEGIFAIFTGPLTSLAPSYYRPLSVFSYWLDFQLFGLRPWGFHFTQNLLHAAVAFAFYRLLLLHFPRGVSFFCALLYGLHPVHAAQVLPLGGRNGILEACWIPALYFLHRSGEKPRAFWASVACFVLALLSKESAVLFPVLAMLYVRLYFRGNRRETLTRRVLGLFAIALAYLLWRQSLPLSSMQSIAPIAAQGIPGRAWTFLASLGQYFALILFPHPLHLERQMIATTWFNPWAWWGLAALLGALYAARKYKPGLRFGLLWFLLLLLPVANLLIVLNVSMAEHWLYLPLAGIVWGLASLAGGKEISPKFAALALAIAFVFGARVYARSFDYRDGPTLYSHDLEYSPNSFYLHANLGVAYSRRGNLFMAKSHLTRALEIAPRSGDVAFNLGTVFEKEGNLARAKELYARAIESSWQPFMYLRLALVHLREGNTATAKSVLQNAARAYPQNMEIRSLLDSLN